MVSINKPRTRILKLPSWFSQDYKSLLYRVFPFLVWGKELDRRTLHYDFLAGITGAIIVLPQGVAYALIAGLPAQYGIYTAIVTPIIAGLFGSSRHLVSGPTAAISIIVMKMTSDLAAVGTDEFISLALTLTFLCGLIQFCLGIARLGHVINFISHTVVIGFTAGAAVLIAASQLKYFFGVPIEQGANVTNTVSTLINSAANFNYYAIAIALVTMGAVLAISRFRPRWPSMLMGMVIGSILCAILGGEKNGISLVGALPGTLPEISAPNLTFDTVSAVFQSAFAVAILGLVEAVSISRSVAVNSGQRISGSREFVGQGLSNIVGSFFSCYAGSGSFTRTGANYHAGAQTPMAAIFAAAILATILVAVPWATAYLPMPAMAGSIMLIAWKLIDFHHIKTILKSNREEVIILLATFGSTVFVELEFAIFIGVILSLVVFLRRTSMPKIVVVAPQSLETGTELRSIKRYGLKECPQLRIVRIDGSIFFGSVNHIQGKLQQFCNRNTSQKHLMLHCPGINLIDIAGVEMLLNEQRRLKDLGGSLTFCALTNIVKDDLAKIGGLEKLGAKNFYSSVDVALKILVPTLEKPICDDCQVRVFNQCPLPPSISNQLRFMDLEPKSIAVKEPADTSSS